SLCALLGVEAAPHLLHLVLPVGISFFTFQSMSYTIDVYRGHIAPRRDPVDFALFVAFFPQLVAGPIVKAIEFFPDHDGWRPPRDAELQRALMLILLGLIEKACIADHLAPYVDGYFGAVHDHPGWLPAATGVLAFALQIFFDFTGYSDIAIGTAMLFGYRFPQNFRRPYLAGNVAEFWHRWHISLSTWLREYLYIPLGGNRGGRLRTLRNLMLTMLLGGMWHGASWNFVIWGGLHGAFLILHRLWRERARPRLPQHLLAGLPYRLSCWALTLAAVGLTWVFFRARELPDALAICRQLVWPDRLGDSVLPVQWGAITALVLGIALLQEHGRLLGRIDESPWPVRAVVFAGMLATFAAFVATGNNVAFLYFQF
ncbi:MAG: MBOAT family protein, partial [Planctomycetota bacterium]